MQLLDFTPGREALISAFESHGAYAIPLGEGRGEGHVYCVRIEPGGAIGPHEAGFGQLFLVVAGSGWVSGGDGVPRPLGAGRGAFIARGEVHAKGSDTGLTAIMVQLTDLAAAPIARAVHPAHAARPGRPSLGRGLAWHPTPAQHEGR